MSSTYGDVDGSGDPGGAVSAQERVDSWPQIQAYKERTYELLGDAAPLLDVGCGPGLDLVALGPARSVGVDASAVMGAAARRRGATVARADAGSLPFPAGAFGGARADRVIQHIADPAAVVGELVRVCRPGGRVVVADPDQETLTIEVPGVRRELSDAVKRLRRDIGYRNGRFVATVPTQLRELGLVDVTVDAFPLVLTDPADAFGLAGWVRYWRREGGFTDADVAEWDAGMAAGPIVYAVVYFVVSGRRAG